MRGAPRERRLFLARRGGGGRPGVCSAQAEVFLAHRLSSTNNLCSLRSGGGFSLADSRLQPSTAFAPRKRRLFHIWEEVVQVTMVCSARTEVLLGSYRIGGLSDSSLRVSGDCSRRIVNLKSLSLSAPRKRRYSRTNSWTKKVCKFCSAHAEVVHSLFPTVRLP